MPFDHDEPSEDVSSLRARLGATLQSLDDADLTWVRSRKDWREHLHSHGFNARWFQWMGDHALGNRKLPYLTEKEFIGFVLHETIPDERLTHLADTLDRYAKLQYTLLEPEATNDVLLTTKQSVVDLLGYMIEGILASLKEAQRLSRLPDGLPYGLGGKELFQISCEYYNEDQRTERLAALLDRATDIHTTHGASQLLLQGVFEAADIAIDVCVPNRSPSASASARHLPLSQRSGLSPGDDDLTQLLSYVVTGFLAANLAQAKNEKPGSGVASSSSMGNSHSSPRPPGTF